MAMLEWLDGSSASSKSFAALPEVCAALDQVFLARADGTGRSTVPVKAISRIPNSGQSQEKSPAANSGTTAVAPMGIISAP